MATPPVIPPAQGYNGYYNADQRWYQSQPQGGTMASWPTFINGGPGWPSVAAAQAAIPAIRPIVRRRQWKPAIFWAQNLGSGAYIIVNFDDHYMRVT